MTVYDARIGKSIGGVPARYGGLPTGEALEQKDWPGSSDKDFSVYRSPEDRTTSGKEEKEKKNPSEQQGVEGEGACDRDQPE